MDMILPPACAACGRSGALLCDGCRAAFVPPSRPEDRFAAPDSGVVIGDALTLGLSAFAHAGSIRRALAALKYTGASRLAPILAGAGSPELGALLRVSGPAALVPVPVHRDRLRERGYNQAALLARSLSESFGLEVLDVLDRIRPTTKQHRLDRAARLANLRDAFAVRGPPTSASVPAVAILVDDIVTTTATLEVCAAVLRAAGAQEVYGFALAREV